MTRLKRKNGSWWCRLTHGRHHAVGMITATTWRQNVIRCRKCGAWYPDGPRVPRIEGVEQAALDRPGE